MNTSKCVKYARDEYLKSLGKKFKSPSTGNLVMFESLPPGEQAKVRDRMKDRPEGYKNQTRQKKVKSIKRTLSKSPPKSETVKTDPLEEAIGKSLVRRVQKDWESGEKPDAPSKKDIWKLVDRGVDHLEKDPSRRKTVKKRVVEKWLDEDFSSNTKNVLTDLKRRVNG